MLQAAERYFYSSPLFQKLPDSGVVWVAYRTSVSLSWMFPPLFVSLDQRKMPPQVPRFCLHCLVQLAS
jgi:hypothetical protein